MAITETLSSEQILSPEFVPDSYKVVRKYQSRQGDGVLLAVKPSLRMAELETGCELVWVEISLLRQQVRVGV